MKLTYDRFDPTSCGFPRPRVPVLPPLTHDQLGPCRSEPAIPRRHYARGRYALRAAYALAGVGPQGALLAPAYHCRTMLDPALQLRAEVALYPLTTQLHADLDGLKRAAAACHTPPAAVLLTHFFGLPRRVTEVATWCRGQGIALVEDCSHALPDTSGYAAAGRPALGRTGRWAVSSPYKFFPCPDGGWLWANDGAPLPPEPAQPAGPSAELRGTLTAWKQWWRPPRAPDAKLLQDELAKWTSGEAVHGRNWTEHTDHASEEYAVADEVRMGLAVSRWIERHTDLPRLVGRRRLRYKQWTEAVASLPGMAALLPDLPPGVAPYMFALHVEDPQRLFHPLKHLGLPIWRWDDMARSNCDISRRYRQGLFHLPCHQALDDAQMEWMTTAVRVVATRS